MNSPVSYAKPDHATYDGVTIALHWLTALLVVGQWSGAMLMELVDERPMRMLYWTVHIGLGTLLFLVIVARLWWRRAGGRTLPPAGDGLVQTLAEWTHRLLYLLVAALIVLGFVIIALRGWQLIGLFTITPVIAGYRPLSSDLIHIHGWTAHVLMVIALGHASVALVHHWVLKDGVLRRMLGAGG